MGIKAKIMEKISPSPTLALAAKAKEMEAEGIDVLALSVGEPDFDTPQVIKDYAIDAIRAGKTKYTAVDGIPELKKAVQRKFKEDNNLDYSLDELIVTVGGKQAIFNCFLATLNEGDEVIIPKPYWVSYPEMVNVAGGVSVEVDTDISNDFKLTPDSLEEAITPNTKWLVLNSPSNPTGMVYSAEELGAIGKVLRKHPHVHILSDDIYEHLIYEKEFYNILNICPDLKERVLIVNGVSKAYAMTGWRIGYSAGNKEIIKLMRIIQSQSTSNPTSISQYASLGALEKGKKFISESKKIFKKRRDLAVKLFKELEGINVPNPDGAFYIFAECKSFLGKSFEGRLISNDQDFCQFLLESEAVVVVPGTAFAMDGYFRFSYAVSEEHIAEAISRIKNFCSKLK